MATTREIDLGVFHLRNVERIKLTLQKDGVAWTGIDSATLILEAPDRTTQKERTMVLVTPDAGVWYYDTVGDPDDATVTADLDQAGTWTATVYVVDGTVKKKYPYEIYFEVTSHP